LAYQFDPDMIRNEGLELNRTENGLFTSDHFGLQMLLKQLPQWIRAAIPRCHSGEIRSANGGYAWRIHQSIFDAHWPMYQVNYRISASNANRNRPEGTPKLNFKNAPPGAEDGCTV